MGCVLEKCASASAAPVGPCFVLEVPSCPLTSAVQSHRAGVRAELPEHEGVLRDLEKITSLDEKWPWPSLSRCSWKTASGSGRNGFSISDSTLVLRVTWRINDFFQFMEAVWLFQKITKQETHVKFYGFAIADDLVTAICHEGYGCAEGVLEHLDNVLVPWQMARGAASIESIEVHGSEKDLEMLQGRLDSKMELCHCVRPTYWVHDAIIFPEKYIAVGNRADDKTLTVLAYWEVVNEDAFRAAVRKFQERAKQESAVKFSAFAWRRDNRLEVVCREGYDFAQGFFDRMTNCREPFLEGIAAAKLLKFDVQGPALEATLVREFLQRFQPGAPIKCAKYAPGAFFVPWQNLDLSHTLRTRPPPKKGAFHIGYAKPFTQHAIRIEEEATEFRDWLNFNPGCWHADLYMLRLSRETLRFFAGVQIVFLCYHTCLTTGRLCLEHDYGGCCFDTVDYCAGQLTSASACPRLVFLNSCSSEELAERLVEKGVQHVICIERDQCMGDSAARLFSRKFACELLSGASVWNAFLRGREAVANNPGFSPSSAAQANLFKLLPSSGDHSATLTDIVASDGESTSVPLSLKVPRSGRVAMFNPPDFQEEKHNVFKIMSLLETNQCICLQGGRQGDSRAQHAAKSMATFFSLPGRSFSGGYCIAEFSENSMLAADPQDLFLKSIKAAFDEKRRWCETDDAEAGCGDVVDSLRSWCNWAQNLRAPLTTLQNRILLVLIDAHPDAHAFVWAHLGPVLEAYKDVLRVLVVGGGSAETLRSRVKAVDFRACDVQLQDLPPEHRI